MTGSKSVCISDIDGSGACGAQRTFGLGTFKFSLFGYSISDFGAQISLDNIVNKRGAIEGSTKPFEYIGFRQLLELKSIGSGKAFTVMVTPRVGGSAVDPDQAKEIDIGSMKLCVGTDKCIQYTFPQKYNTGVLDSSGNPSTAGGKTSMIKIVVSWNGAKSLRKLYIDYLMSATELVSATTKKWFVYDPDVDDAPPTASPTNSPTASPTAPGGSGPTNSPTASPTAPGGSSASTSPAASPTAAPVAYAGATITQAVEFSGLTVSAYMGDTKSGYELGYAKALSLTTVAPGATTIIYKTGVTVASAVARRAATVTFTVTLESTFTDTPPTQTGITSASSASNIFSAISAVVSANGALNFTAPAQNTIAPGTAGLVSAAPTASNANATNATTSSASGIWHFSHMALSIPVVAMVISKM